MNEAGDWMALFTGQIPVEEAGPLLRQTSAEFHTFLQAHPEALEQVMAIIEKRLRGGLTPESWGLLESALTHYLGRDLTYLLSWVLQYDQSNRLQELERYAPPSVMHLFRTILSLHGPELEEAYTVWNEIPDNWRTVYREIYYDQLSRRYLLRVRIEKYNGEELTIEGPPDAILTLASYLLLTARLVGVPEVFSENAVNLFLTEAGELARLLLPEEEGSDNGDRQEQEA